MASQHGKVVTLPCNYKTGKTLGQGSYATVKEVVNIHSGNKYAAKVINKALMKGREAVIQREIEILQKITQGHPNVLTLIDYFESVHNIYLVTELLTGGELFDQICEMGTHTERDASKIIHSLVSGISYLHSKGIVHRDIKPENIIFKTREPNSDIVIADFGLSRVIGDDEDSPLKTLCGSPGYISPEVILKVGHGKPVDMWAIGVVTYFLICGMPPFQRETMNEEVKAILGCDYAFLPIGFWSKISAAAQQFVSSLLLKDAEQRMTAAEALTHPWLRGERSMVMPAPAKNQPPIYTFVGAKNIDVEELDDNEALAHVRLVKPGEIVYMSEFDLIPRISRGREGLKKILNMVRIVNSMKPSSHVPVDESF